MTALIVRDHIDSWPFIGPFHSKPVVFFESINHRSIKFSAGTFFVSYWHATSDMRTIAFATAEEAVAFAESHPHFNR